jgi:predicted ABC-type ATPase
VTPQIFVLAGVNGAGKSSVAGASFRRRGTDFFNPDEMAAQISKESGCSLDEANALAWTEGKERLEKAIQKRTNFIFETTLGGNTIPRLLQKAADEGFDVRIWFVGLSSVEQHMARVRARVASGGHDIPEEKIRERWDASRRNIIRLMQYVSEIRVFDNSAERDPETGTAPAPRLVLHWKRGIVVSPSPSDLEATPEWAKPIVAAALQLTRRN